MRRMVITSLFVFLIAALAISFGGLLLMHHAGKLSFSQPCEYSGCVAVPTGEMGGLDCMLHCVKTITDMGFFPTITLTQGYVLVFFAFLIVFVQPFLFRIRQFFRSDHSIARLLLRQKLATVILRD